MKRTLTVAAALLLCAFTAAAQDKDKKDRDHPAAAQPAKPAKPDRPATPFPRPQRAEPMVRPVTPSPTFRPVPSPSPSLSPQVQPRPDRPARPDTFRKPDRPDKPAAFDKPATVTRPTPRPRPDTAGAQHAPRPPRPDKPRPQIAGGQRPRPSHAALPTKPTHAARPARSASPQAVARSRQLRLTLRTNRVRTYSYRGHTLRAVRARPYAYPHGWRYRAWRKHQRFPAELFLSAFFLNNFLNYGLSSPPPGYEWVRFGPDAVLVDRNSYDIADTAYGVFDDGSGYGGGYSDNADLPPIDEDMPQDFATGELDLAAGVDQSNACEFFYGDRQTQDDIDQAWADQDWNGLAKTVIWAGCGNDISYYLLGLAAEGLALPDAAAGYYGRAVELADGDADSTFKCAISGPDACRGMDIAGEASDGLDRIYGPAN